MQQRQKADRPEESRLPSAMMPDGLRKGRLLAVDSQVMTALRMAFDECCGKSPSQLVENLVRAFPERCGDGGLVISHKTVRTFFQKGAAAPGTVDILCTYLLGRAYDQCLAKLVSSRTVGLQPPPYRVGREENLARYLSWIRNRSVRAIFLSGEGGIGKTTLAEALAWAARNLLPQQVLLRLNELKLPDQMLRECLTSLGHPHPNRVQDPGQVVLNYLKERPCLIIIDNLDSVLDNLGFQGQQQPWRRIFETWMDTEHQSLIVFTSRERPWLQPTTRAYLREERILGLPPTDWLPFFRERYRDYACAPLLEEPIQQCALTTLGSECAGHPLALHLIAGEVLSQGNGDLMGYLKAHGPALWSHEGITRLITDQFERLAQADPVSWKLLVRMGVYRYTLPVALPGLELLLWDEPHNSPNRLRALINRSLVQLDPAGGYQLHPLIARFSQQELCRQGWLNEAHEVVVRYWEQLARTACDSSLCIAYWREAFSHWCALNQWEAAAIAFQNALNAQAPSSTMPSPWLRGTNSPLNAILFPDTPPT